MEKTIGKFICELRKAKGMTQKDLARNLIIEKRILMMLDKSVEQHWNGW